MLPKNKNMNIVPTRLSTPKVLNSLKLQLKSKGIDYIIDEPYLLTAFSNEATERMKPPRKVVATIDFNDAKVRPYLIQNIPMNAPQAILLIENKVANNELKNPGDMVPVLIKDGNMYFWILGLITRLGGFHLCVRFFGENKWKKGRILYIGYQYTSRA